MIASSLLKIGDMYRNGIVGYIKNPKDVGYVEGEQHGFIVSINDVLGDYGCNWSDAQRACSELDGNGSGVWRLPSITELKILYGNRGVIGGFKEVGYWSSTDEGTKNDAYIQIFNKASLCNHDEKTAHHSVRAVQDF